jgi:hypothetical protein
MAGNCAPARLRTSLEGSCSTGGDCDRPYFFLPADPCEEQRMSPSERRLCSPSSRRFRSSLPASSPLDTARGGPPLLNLIRRLSFSDSLERAALDLNRAALRACGRMLRDGIAVPSGGRSAAAVSRSSKTISRSGGGGEDGQSGGPGGRSCSMSPTRLICRLMMFGW